MYSHKLSDEERKKGKGELRQESLSKNNRLCTSYRRKKGERKYGTDRIWGTANCAVSTRIHS